MVSNKKWYVNWVVVLLYVLYHFSLGLYHWLSTLLTTVCPDVGFFVFIELGVSISYLQISVSFPFDSFLWVPISWLRLLGSLLGFSCIENIFHAMKTLRKVKITALRSLSVSSNIWFILGLNSIDFLLCRERVPFSWCLGCREILDCILNNIKLWRFLSGLELQTLFYVAASLCSNLLSLAGLLKI